MANQNHLSLKYYSTMQLWMKQHSIKAKLAQPIVKFNLELMPRI